MKKLVTVFLLTVFMAATLLFAGCAAGPAAAPAESAAEQGASAPTQEGDGKSAATGEGAADVKIAFISNQRAGDQGPVDNMLEGVKKAEEEFGVTIKTLESEDPASYTDDVRAMAKDGYDLIITTFPPMSEATKQVATEYPDTKFAAIFQYINVDGTSIENVWDTDYRGDEAAYALGKMAAALTSSGKIGYVGGNDSVGVYENVNAFMRAVRDTNPEATVEFISVGSYEDPAKAKEMTIAMINKGVDVLQTDCGNSQVGVIEAAAENPGVFVSGDVSNNTALAPGAFFSYMGVDFGNNVYLAVKYFLEGSYPGGEQGIMNVASGTYFIPFDVLDTLAENLPEQADLLAQVRAVGEETVKKISDGEIVVDYDIEAPSWERILNE